MMLKEMNYVYAVYKERGFLKAAQSLYITQPVVSTLVKRAEAEFNARIFDRTTSPVSLTPAGKLYIQAVEQILAIQDEILSLFVEPAVEHDCHIRIGASSLFCSYILPPVVREFKKKLGNVEVYWKEAHNVELAELLQNGALDFVLEADDLDSSVFDSIIWSEELLILAVPVGNPINGRLAEYRYTSDDIRRRRHLEGLRPCVPLELFAQEPFVFLRDGNDIALRGAMLCNRAGFRPQIAMKVDQLITAYNLAKGGGGATVISDNIPQYDDDADKLFFYTLDSPLVHRNVRLYAYRNRPRSSVAEAFWEYARQLPSA